MTPNALAWAALGVWPLVALVVLASPRSRAHLARTTAWLILLPTMFLPSAIELKTPGIPALDKHRLAFLAVGAGLLMFHRERFRSGLRGRWFPVLVLVVLVAGAAATVSTNGDLLTFGPTVLPALHVYDILSMAGGFVLSLYLPFAVGLEVFRTEEDVWEFFRAFTSCALLYVPFALVEVRLSPQFHYWLYGYFPSQFLQAIRGTEFRPVIFMNHGLSVAMFFALAFTGALGLRRVGARMNPAPGPRAWVIAGALLACKSWASIIYATCAFFAERSMRSRAGALALGVVVLLVAAYPVTRALDVFPAKALVQAVRPYSEERAASLEFRFQNEDLLVRRALLRPWFGWGGFARNRVYGDWGGDMTVTDGQWVIVLGVGGVVGLGGLLALILVPILRFARRCRTMPAARRAMAGTLAITVAIGAVDILPNAWSDYLPLLFAGALFALTGSAVGTRKSSERSPRRSSEARAVSATRFVSRSV